MKKKSIIEIFECWVEMKPNKKAYVFLDNCSENEDKSITFKQVYEEAYNYAGYLRKRGVEKGDRIIIFGEQNIESIISIYGVILAGAAFVIIPTPIDNGKKERFEHVVKSSGAKHIICNDKDVKYIKDNMNIDVIKTSDIKADNYNFEIDIQEDDIACLQYTSGSINEPKGIIWTHRNIYESIKTLSKYTFEEDTFVTWLPFFHSMGLLTGVLLNMYLGNTNVILTTDMFINNPIDWLKKISEYRSSMVWAPNSAYMACINLLSSNTETVLDLSCIKHLINCSESISVNEWENIRKCFSKYGLKEDALTAVYGLSEAVGEVSGGSVKNITVDSVKLQKNMIIKATSESSRTKTLSCVGKIIDSVKVAIVNPDTLEECKDNETGEIWVQGDKVAYGYWNNEEAAKDTFNIKLKGYEGEFLRTGDVGGIYDNELYIVGRIKEMFIINGHNIFPRDIEVNIKNNIEELQDKVVYCFSVTKANKERIVIAIEAELEKEKYKSITKNVREIIYKYFNIEPYDIVITGDQCLRRTDNGKIALSKNRKAYLCDELKVLYSTRNSVIVHKKKPFTQRGLEIKKFFEDILETECVSMDDDFFALGGSSLKTVLLIEKINKAHNIKVSSNDIFEYSTIEKVIELIDIKTGKKVKDNSDDSVVIEEVAAGISEEDEKEKRERRLLADGCINNNIMIRDIEMYYPDNKINVDEIIQDFKEKGQDIETLVKEQLCKETLYLTDNEGENSFTMELEAINRVLKRSGLIGKDFDIIVSTVTVPEYTVPPLSLLIHNRIKGKKDAVCYDMNVNCAGMLSGMIQIYRRMESDLRINRALLVGSEFSAVHMSQDDFKMRSNLSDAACAVIIERSDIKAGLLDSKTYVNTKSINGYAFPGCGFSKIYKSPIEEYYTKIGDSSWNTDKAGSLIRSILKENYLKLEDVSLICSTQLVGFNLKLLRKNLNISEDKLLYIGDEFGYTGTCAPFTVLYEGIKRGKVKRGDYVILWTIGAGGYYLLALIKY